MVLEAGMPVDSAEIVEEDMVSARQKSRLKRKVYDHFSKTFESVINGLCWFESVRLFG